MGLKCLITDNVPKAASNEAAILLRAKKPVTTTITAVLKNDHMLDWDHSLILSSVKALIEHQITSLKAEKKEKLASKLRRDSGILLGLVVEDQLLLTPKALHATFNALFAKDQHFTDILRLHRE